MVARTSRRAYGVSALMAAFSSDASLTAPLANALVVRLWLDDGRPKAVDDTPLGGADSSRGASRSSTSCRSAGGHASCTANRGTRCDTYSCTLQNRVVAREHGNDDCVGVGAVGAIVPGIVAPAASDHCASDALPRLTTCCSAFPATNTSRNTNSSGLHSSGSTTCLRRFDVRLHVAQKHTNGKRKGGQTGEREQERPEQSDTD